MHLDSFVFSALLLLLVTSIAVIVFRHLGLGSVLGLLVAGVIVGPYSPGPSITEHVEDLRHFTELGVVLLLFLIGLEIKPDRLWAMRRAVFGLGSLQILFTAAAITAYALFFQPSWQAALLIGSTFALSSTAFVLQLLQERGEIASEHGSTAFSILLMQDLSIVPLLALVPILSDTGPLSAEVPLLHQVLIVVSMLLLLLGFGRFLLPKVLDYLAQQQNREGFVLAVMLAVFVAAWSMHHAGLSMALGAFLMGMLLSGSRYRLQIQAHVEPYKGLLMSLFFVAVGMSIDIQALSANFTVFLQHTLIVVVIKLLVLFVLALAFGFSQANALRLSTLLAQGGEFGFVLFGSAKALQVIDDQTFVLAIGVISVTMLLTPLLVRFGDSLAKRLERGQEANIPEYQAVTQQPAGQVVIGGYGRVGHTVAALLNSSGIPVVVFDTNPERVAQGREDGLHVFYGDIADPDLLEAAQVDQMALVVLTLDNGPKALDVISHLRNTCPDVPVITRARDLATSSQLLEAGATHAFPEALESSLRLGALAMELINVPQDNVDLLLQGVRKDNYELVAEESKSA